VALNVQLLPSAGLHGHVAMVACGIYRVLDLKKHFFGHYSAVPECCQVYFLDIFVALLKQLYLSVCSSVSTVSDYRLMAGVRTTTEAKDFSSNLCVQTDFRPNQPPIQWVPVALYPGANCGRGVMLTAHPLLGPRLRKSKSYTSCHPKHLHGV
jgi:hypothetical protein